MKGRSRGLYDEGAQYSEWGEAVAVSGAVSRAPRSSGAAKTPKQWLTDQAQQDFAEAVFLDTNKWNLPFWWVERPFSAPAAKAVFAYAGLKGRNFPKMNPGDRRWEVPLREAGPLVL